MLLSAAAAAAATATINTSTAASSLPAADTGLAPGRKDQCIMIDFGLTRKYRLPSGQIRPPRDIAGFRGTARYASINSHLSKELSRRDDLWSVLYVLIEFLTGQLPWRKLKDKEEIGLLKIHFNRSPALLMIHMRVHKHTHTCT